ncbi:BgTH12-03170 [Blumeria graminis f. sp. triticale]|uniref:BgTH12-03170 n=1 Tax=Blumeria graminis f. sp. triticale TaxID=1689686 RepID=A0A9W4D377_BLUGR|nr:BgTH12-03170 [Blumeria graminis f. sp. triticale]
MCGIYVSIAESEYVKPGKELEKLLCNRGTDYAGYKEVQIEANNGKSYYLSFNSTVLALRGNDINSQPFFDTSSGSVLCWNGEAWKIGRDLVTGNDGKALFSLLLRASSTESSSKASTAIREVISSISGPFAYVFFDKLHQQLYFGRDRIGRRSLLCSKFVDGASFLLSSVADPTIRPWEEIDASGIYQLSLVEHVVSPVTPHYSNPFNQTCKHQWTTNGDQPIYPSLGNFNSTIPLTYASLNLQSASVESLRHHLIESVRLRVSNILQLNPSEGSGVSIAILFSGGLDCSVLARIVHDILPAHEDVDLINVAFENPRAVNAAKNQSSNKDTSLHVTATGHEDRENNPYENCPDRKTGRKSLMEIQSICPGRTWRFLAVNIPYSETLEHRQIVINLIHPHNTEMDLSIAYALYFASRGIGLASSSPLNGSPYKTPARILLSGLGADELFGGYVRHSTAFRRMGYEGLLSELSLDINRLGKRNLGRDDRVMSHWSKEARFPYLDEELVSWAVETLITEKCGFGLSCDLVESEPVIEAGKKVLRLLAFKLGLRSVATEKKRAIQFGSRTAKMEIGNVKGTNLIC